MKIIALDLGDKRVGIAILVQGISIPKKIISRVEIINFLKKYQKEYDFEKIIVGLPYDLHGILTKQLEKTQNFIEKLKKIFPDKEIIGIDERFTTFEAKIDNNKKYIDDVSASLILETYLTTKK